MNGEYPYCETGSFTDELKRAAFEAIYKDGCDDCGGWIDTLIAIPKKWWTLLGIIPMRFMQNWKICGKLWTTKTPEQAFA